jgi:hypothetical protein
MASETLRIVGVELGQESMATYRALNDRSSTNYPVIVYLSRPVDEFETRELRRFNLVIDDDDAMCAPFESTTLESIENNLGYIHADMSERTTPARVRESG